MPALLEPIRFLMPKILLFNKPFGVLSQFTSAFDKPTLANFISHKGFYAAGRLDQDSEGLMVLTDNGKLQQKISEPKFKTTKIYYAQVEGEIDQLAIDELTTGIMLKDGLSLPALAIKIIDPEIWRRDPPIRKRLHIPTSWLKLSITEGRNRQVRRMTAAVGFPTLRLIRVQIGTFKLGNLRPGESLLEES